MAEWLDETEVASVMGLQKRINQDIRWRGRDGYQEFSVDVLSEQADYDMTLKGVITEATGYLKLHLFVGAQPIVMLHCGKVHHNPNCERLTARAHKHLWSDPHRDKQAHVPADLDLSTWETAFRGFLEECNIEFHGQFTAPSIQRRML